MSRIHRARRSSTVGRGALAVAALSAALLLPTAASAAPGVPAAPTAVYTENFENFTAGTETTPVLLTSYTGAGGQTYTADPAWLTDCNGNVISGVSTNAAGCSAGNNTSIKSLATQLGTLNGTAPANTNHAVSAFTAANPGADAVEFATAAPLALATANRFLTFSVNVDAVNCGVSAPSLKFYLVDAGTEIPTFTTPINPCVAPFNGLGSFAGNKATLFSGASFGIVMRNGNGSGTGNDHAFDDIKVLDATPKLDQSFGPTSVAPGAPTTLTYTITNTDELGEKDGFSFTDHLPSGLTVASPADVTTTCAGGTPTATAGGGTITFTGGKLDAGDSSCTVTVKVTPAAVGSVTSAPADFDVTGLDLPSPAPLLAVAPFACHTSTLFVAQGSPTQLNALGYGSGSATFTPIGAPAGPFNAIGFNPQDRLIYGIEAGSSNLLQIDQAGTTRDLGPLSPALPGGINVGAFDPDGNYYVMSGALSPLYKVDVHTLTSTTIALTGAALPVGADFTWIGDALWAQNSSDDTLVRVDPATGIVKKFAQPAGVPSGVAAGAAWTYADGDLGLSDNATGRIYRVQITNPDSAAPTFKVVASSPGPPSANNDGTACTGDPADLSLTKTTSPNVEPGKAFSWTLTVHNAGPGDSSGFSVSDDVPAGVTSVATSTPGCTAAGGSVSCIHGALANGEDFLITITGTAPAATGTVITNTASLAGNEPDPDPADNTSTSKTTVAPPPTVKITDPAPGTAITTGDSVPGHYGCTGTGLPLSCTATVTLPDGTEVPLVDGGPLPTGQPGPYAITATVVDQFGNKVTTTRTYQVVPKPAPPEVTFTGGLAGGDGGPVTVDQGADLTALFACSAAAGVQSCTGTSANGAKVDTSIPGTYTFTVTVVDKLGRTVSKTVTIVVRPKAGTPKRTAAQLALECSGAKLVLLDVRRLGTVVRLQGVTSTAQAGKKVSLRFSATGVVVARPVVQPNGFFEATAALPPLAIRATNRARYQAFLEGEKSLNLKLNRRMISTGLAPSKGLITISGNVTAPLAKPIATIFVKQRTECGKPYAVVAKVKPNAKGFYRVTFAKPAGVDSAIYRLETKVRRFPNRRLTSPTYTLIRGVDLF